MNEHSAELALQLKAGTKAKTKSGQEILVARVHTDDHGQHWVQPKGADFDDWLIPASMIESIDGTPVTLTENPD